MWKIIKDILAKKACFHDWKLVKEVEKEKNSLKKELKVRKQNAYGIKEISLAIAIISLEKPGFMRIQEKNA